jgi:ABC-type glycerol-3-phosphate transport system substrate-binding protein
MKRISMIIFAVAMTVSFAACSGAQKKAEEPKEATKTAAQTTDSLKKAAEETVSQEVTPAEAVKAFTAYAKEYADAYNNITKDPNKYTKLARQSQEKVADMERLKIDFTKKQLEEYQKAFEIVKKINSSGK